MKHRLDASFSLPDPLLVAQQGWDAEVYLGPARPSQEWCDACTVRGVVLSFVQQTVSERAQEGYNAGIYDAQYADRRANERGHSLDGELSFVVSDGSRDNPTWNGDAIADYGQAIAQQCRRPFKFYGNRYAVDHANAGAARVSVSVYGIHVRNLGRATNGGWVPRTWNADFDRDLMIQEIGYYYDAGGTCDRNTVLRDFASGAPAPDEEDDEMRVFITKKGAPAGSPEAGVWEQAGNSRRHVGPDEWAAIQFIAGLEGKTVGVLDASAQWWDTLPDVSSLVDVAGGGGAPGAPVSMSLHFEGTGRADPV